MANPGRRITGNERFGEIKGMVRGGLSSVSFRNANPELIIAHAKKHSLGGIEWSADTHVPHGDLKQAERLMMATLRAGLTISAYGSFYRLIGERGEKSFDAVLETARRLQAPTIRLWSGATPTEYEAKLPNLIGAAKNAADKAGKLGITVCLEPHQLSAVSTYDTLGSITEAVDHPFFRICWTQLPNTAAEARLCAAERLASLLALVHLRNWTDAYERKALDPNEPCWRAVMGMAEYGKNSVLDRWAIIEYLEKEDESTLEREALALTARLAS